MFNFIRINNNQPQKKLFTARNFDLVNNLVKDEAAFTGGTESTVIENLILSSYLNLTCDDLVYPVANILFDSANGVATTCKAIFEGFALKPELANDTLLPLLGFVENIEARHRTIIDGSEPALNQIAKYSGLFKDQLDKYDGEFYEFIGPGNTHVHIDKFDLMILNEMSNALSYIEDINIDGSFSTLINTVRKYWYFEGDTDTAGMRNWTCTYRILAAICSLAKWPDYPQYRYELVQIIRKITMSDGKKGSYDSKQPSLRKQIFLKGGKSLITTDEAVVLESPSRLEHTHAEIIIHGPNSRRTLAPFIITFTDEEQSSINEIIEKLVQEDPRARKEFPNPRDAYSVPIYSEGSYNDNRVKWNTI